MTCIVGVAVPGKGVVLGGDSCGSNGHGRIIVKEPKVFLKNANLAIGYTTSFSFGQLLKHSLQIPKRQHTRQDEEEWLHIDFVNAVRECLKTGGYLRTSDGREEGGQALLAYKDRLFSLQSDHALLEHANGYAAVGSGEMSALGALYATDKLKGRARVEIALAAAAEHVVTVAPPFHYVQTEL